MSVYELSGSGFEPSDSHLNFRFCPTLSKEFLDIQATTESGFTLKRVRDMTRTFNHKSRNEFCFKKKTLHNGKKGIIVLCEIFNQ